MGWRIVAIVGTRNMTKRQEREVSKLVYSLHHLDDVVISGGAAGVDKWAVLVAKSRGMTYEVYEPDYEADGKAAPLVRNREIAERCTELHAFPGPESRGTWHVVGLAKKLGRKVVIHKEGA